MKSRGLNNKAQMTIFIVVAVVLVAGAITVFVMRDSLFDSAMPASFEPVYSSFLLCLEDETRIGIDVLESQGGYIELPEFERGSTQMPFSSYLDFLGNPIPYWYYVSQSNIQKEQVPTESQMEEQLASFVEDKIRGCLLDSHYQQGFEIIQDVPEAKMEINSDSVEVSLKMDLTISRLNDTVLVKDHKVTVDSKLGKLYEVAKEIYEYEQKSLFLENYAVDTMRVYAPVDGVDLDCAPLVWSAEEVFDELKSAIEANTMALKVKGGDFSLKQEENKYFIVDVDVPSDVEVMFLNSPEWANNFEVNPTEGAIMISKPVGNQPGLGALGFCYVPYHYVYNLGYPVLAQVYSGQEIFQFPMAVVIRGNKPREPLDTSAIDLPDLEICKNKNTYFQVNTYDNSLNPVNANISFECFSESCKIGETEDGILVTEFPQCTNAIIRAEAGDYGAVKVIQSTNEEGVIDILMNKLYEVEIDLNLGKIDYGGEAIISFLAEGGKSTTILYPDTKKVELSEGQYEIQVSVYKNSSLKLQETTTQECVEIPKSSLGGIFGLTEEKCFDIVIPAQIVSNVLAGGGTQKHYILEDDLIGAEFIEIGANKFPTPKAIEELQVNYLLFEETGLEVNFR